jgi:serine/threonine protein kinase
MVLGTASYMAPEQAKGQPVDARVDVWAFGCVLFEMLTGQRAFGGDDVTETITSVLRDAPDLSLLPPAVPAHVRSTLQSCLEKDLRRRWRSIGDVQLLLDGQFNAGTRQTSPVSRGLPLAGECWEPRSSSSRSQPRLLSAPWSSCGLPCRVRLRGLVSRCPGARASWRHAATCSRLPSARRPRSGRCRHPSPRIPSRPGELASPRARPSCRSTPRPPEQRPQSEMLAPVNLFAKEVLVALMTLQRESQHVPEELGSARRREPRFRRSQ